MLCARALVHTCTHFAACALSSVIVQEAAAGTGERDTARRFEVGPAPDGDLLKDHCFGEPPSRGEFGERRVLRQAVEVPFFLLVRVSHVPQLLIVGLELLMLLFCLAEALS